MHGFSPINDQEGVCRNTTVQGSEKYFTDCLLYQKNGKVAKKLLSDDIDIGNEADSKSGEDLMAILDEEPIIAYFIDHDCNNSVEMTANGSLMKISILIILCILMMYIVLLI